MFLILEIVSYVAARFTGFDKTEPGRIWLGARSGNNFNCLAALQWLAQRGEAAADATGHTGITDICVDGIGKVYGSGACRQFKDAALGCEYIDFVWKQVNFDVLDEFQRITRVLLHLQ